MKISFTCDHTPEESQYGSIASKHYEPVYPKISMEFEATTLHAILTEFRHFLLACGYAIDGEIGEIESFESTPSQEFEISKKPTKEEKP